MLNVWQQKSYDYLIHMINQNIPYHMRKMYISAIDSLVDKLLVDIDKCYYAFVDTDTGCITDLIDFNVAIDKVKIEDYVIDTLYLCFYGDLI